MYGEHSLAAQRLFDQAVQIIAILAVALVVIETIYVVLFGILATTKRTGQGQRR